MKHPLLGVVANACNSGIEEVGSGGSRVRGQPKSRETASNVTIKSNDKSQLHKTKATQAKKKKNNKKPCSSPGTTSLRFYLRKDKKEKKRFATSLVRKIQVKSTVRCTLDTH